MYFSGTSELFYCSPPIHLGKGAERLSVILSVLSAMVCQRYNFAGSGYLPLEYPPSRQSRILYAARISRVCGAAAKGEV
jgi:hypothetical protein